ncbi:beta-N-acetylhexosaminidase [Rhizosphaericola mali]|uniref:beta-N-acetylhexosaminidase n=1 Tax=Rhizosphaericola mali TaxID=2545455 RepID=A0A5P2G2W0_9BACT|nr:beta-N-acetylhexosaminidase [Rhizosphaericola mali]QES89537.1 beta-N-acetylhexosaminidase [Rhizosphaericola mali]
MKKLLLALSFLLAVEGMQAQTQVNIIPKPNQLTVNAGNFTFSKELKIYVGKGGEKTADYLKKYLADYLDVTTITTNKKDAQVLLEVGSGKGVKGAYSLNVTPKNVVIKADNEEGVFYGMQSLLQLLPTTKETSISIPDVAIIDAPRFQYRGLMLDCGRHFMPADFVKQYIDFIALHKMNTFHWHLTEDQGWRIEIKKYPKLTEVGAWRNGTIIGHHPGTGNDETKEGGFYTQEQVKDIVKYAADRYITVIPEIEMPGHSSAAIAAYPELSCFPEQPTEVLPGVTWFGPRDKKEVQQSWGVYPDIYVPSENTFTFLENVLSEVLPLFPSRYVHIGGDEAPKDYWKKSAFCQQLIKEKGLKDEEGLQSYFVERIVKFLNSKGKSVIGWDEILEGGIAPNATIMSWRGEKGGIAAAKLHHNVIMTPGEYVYLDHAQLKHEDSLTIGGYLPYQNVYKYDPIPKELAKDEYKYVLGAQGNVWTEYMAGPTKVEYMVFPRLAALSETLWTEKKNKDLPDFNGRLKSELERYTLWNINYCKNFNEN